MIPGYSQNAVLQLIVALGVGFVAYFFTTVLFQAFAQYPAAKAVATVLPKIALPAVEDYPSRWWTIFTYGWAHTGFWVWITNMIWLYCWGSVVQMLVGHRQVIPLFVYSLIAGGMFFLLAQLVPGKAFDYSGFLLGCHAGVMALAVAAMTLAPNYRFYLGPSFSIPMVIVAAIYGVLAVVDTDLHPVLLLSLGGGALTGFVYAKMLQAGRRPGDWVYNLFSSIERSMTPDEQIAWKKEKHRRNQVLSKNYEPKQGISQQRIDELLEKIHKNGYNALTREEKEMLLRASKENE